MFHKIALICVIFLNVISCVILGGALAPQAATITLNSNVTYPAMSGWESTTQAGELACPSVSFVKTNNTTACPAFLNYKDTLFNQMVNDLGINRLRVEVQPGIENPTDNFQKYLNNQITERDWTHNYAVQAINDNNDPTMINWSGFQFTSLDHRIDNVVLPIKQLVEARGEHLFINVCFVDFSANPLGFEHYTQPDEYAELVLAVYQHLQDKYGFVPDTWEIELEPDNTPFDGTKMGNALKATAALLEAHGFKPRFVVPSTTNMTNAISYFNAIKAVIGDGGVRKYVNEISYHRYSGVSESSLKTIGETALSYGIGGSMLEHIGSDYQDLHQDLIVGNNSAWSQYTIATPYFWGSDDNGAAYYKVNDTNPSNPQIILGSRTKFLRQYFRFIRAGAVRIEANTSDGNFSPVSFINPDGKYVVVVKASAAGSLSIQGLPAGLYGIKYTTNSEYNKDSSDVTINSGQVLNASIPAAGVITFYAKTSSSSAPPPAPEVTPSPNSNYKLYLPFLVTRRIGSNLQTVASICSSR